MCPLEVIPKITLPIKFLAIKARHGKTGGSCRVWVGSIGLQVKRVTGKKLVILSGLKMSSGQLVAGQVKLTRIFHMNFFYIIYIYIYIYFFIKKTTCICHLESYATNYLM